MRVFFNLDLRHSSNPLLISHSALKLRYNLPVYSPALPPTLGHLTPGEGNTPLASPAPARARALTPEPPTLRFPTAEPPIIFDAPLIARKEDGWESMLEDLVLRWVSGVVEERRGRESMSYI